MFKDEREKLNAWYQQLLLDMRQLDLKASLVKVLLICWVWSALASEIFFNSFLFMPATMVLFLPVVFFLFEYVKIYKIIQLQDKMKFFFELVASFIQGGKVIDTALGSAYERMLEDTTLPTDFKQVIQGNQQKLRLNLDQKYSLKALGDYTALESIARVDWICDYCVASGLEIDDVYLQCARNLGRQQIFRRELMHQLNAKQQEFMLMILAPGFVKLMTTAMMGSYFEVNANPFVEAMTGLTLTGMYVLACCLYLYTYNQMLRGTYENF